MNVSVIDQIEGKLKKIAQDERFEYFIFVIIVLAGIIVGLQTIEGLRDNYLLSFLDNLILWIFVVEILIKMGVKIRKPWEYFYDSWQVFDFIIVAVCFLPYFIPNAHTEYFAVLRLARILRLIRLFNKIKNLRVIIHSLMKSLPKMVYVFLLLLLLFYIYGILGTDIFGIYDKDNFGTLLVSMRTLFIVAFEGWSWIYDADGINRALEDGQIADWAIVTFFVSFTVFCAMLVLNLFIGILTSDISDTEAEEKKGRTKVHKKNHTIILGWSQKIFPTIRELFEANEADERKYIVVMADVDVDEMENEIEHKIYKERENEIKRLKEEFNYARKNNSNSLCASEADCELMDYRKNSLQIIYRRGDPTDQSHLEIVNPQEANSVIIFVGDDEEKPDYYTIKTILGLENQKSKLNQNAHIVAEFQDFKLMQLAEKIGAKRLVPVYTDQFISRLITQTCLQPSLSKVYSEILGFSGNEIYVVSKNDFKKNKNNYKFFEENIINNVISFEELSYCFEDSCLLGIMRKDNSRQNSKEKWEVLINPNPDEIIDKDDKLILLAEDASTIYFSESGKNNIDDKNINSIIYNSEFDKPILIVGYNSKTNIILNEIDSYSPKGLIIKLVINDETDRINFRNEIQNFKNIQLEIHQCDFDDSDSIDKLEIKDIKHIILLNESKSTINTSSVDADLLVALLQLRNYQRENNCDFSIITEIKDIRSVELLKAEMNNEFIVSENIQAGIIAQLSQIRELKDVFDYLLKEEGSEIYLKPVESYVKNFDNLNFYTIMKSAFLKHEIPIGYLDEEQQITINPVKSKPINIKNPKRFKMIVLAEHV